MAQRDKELELERRGASERALTQRPIGIINQNHKHFPKNEHTYGVVCLCRNHTVNCFFMCRLDIRFEKEECDFEID